MPKISCSSCPALAVLREHLEKVPTILYFLKQKVDIPVPRRGGVGGLPGLRPGQSSNSGCLAERCHSSSSSWWCWTSSRFTPRSSTSVAEQNVSTSVPRRGGPRGGQGFPQDQGSAVTFFCFFFGDAGEGGFRTFSPPNKSAKVHGQMSVRVHAHSSSSELRAHGWTPMAMRGCVLDTARNSYWQNLDTGHPPWDTEVWARCSGLWSRTWTFQFLVTEGDLLVFKVFPLNRVQQRLRRRSLTFPFLVEVFKVFAQDKVHLLSLSSWCS